MNNDELEVKFLRLLQEFTDIKLKRRERFLLQQGAPEATDSADLVREKR